MDPGRIKPWVDIVAGVVTPALLIWGVIFAVYKFGLSDSPSAQLQNEQLKQYCLSRGSLDIGIVATDTLSGSLALVGDVTLKNVGTVPVVIGANEPLLAIKLVRDGSGEFRRDKTLTAFPFALLTPAGHVEGSQAISGLAGEEHSATVVSVLPGRTMHLPFIFSAESGAYYYLQFNGGPREVDPDSGECAGATKGTSSDPYEWFAAAILRAP